MTSNREVLYFSCDKGYLDSHTLQYKWFGALWIYKGNTRVVLGYWFGNCMNEIRKQTKNYGTNHDCSTKELLEVYVTIRELQKEQDWKQRSRLPVFTLFKSSWRNLELWWYILRSRNTYPCYVSALQKKKFSIWLKHLAVCEIEDDLYEFIKRVNKEHDFQLQLLNNDSHFFYRKMS